MLAELPADHVRVIIKNQYPKYQAPGSYVWPIGMALEAVKIGRAIVDPQSEKVFAEFRKHSETPRSKSR